MKMILPAIVAWAVFGIILTALVSCAASAAEQKVERVHLDAYDVPLLVPGGDIAPACVVDLHKGSIISTMALVGFCTDVLPEFKHQMESDGVTTIVTLSINGHNINLT